MGLKTLVVTATLIGSTWFGTITDNKETITGARISSKDTVVYSDLDGKFKIDGDSIKIQFISYNDTVCKSEALLKAKIADFCESRIQKEKGQ